MSIKGDVRELKELNSEIKRLSTRLRTLREHKKKAEERILLYLNAKEQPGVKYDGTAIIIQKKEKRRPKAGKEREADAIIVLRDHGIDNPERVLKEIMEARRGDTEEGQSLKLKRLPDH